ncbi:MAG: metallophosphoesterase [Pseudomonadota bacterium]
MPRDIWFISDTHFGHEKVIAFGRRPFANVAEMDLALAENWSRSVKPQDLIYHLGDVAWSAEGLELFAKLPGTKRLILGNHDSGKRLAPHVQKLVLYRRFPEDQFIASHMPLLPERGREPINVHGHVHAVDVDHPSFVNISVEKTDYAPLHIDDLRARVAAALKATA